MLGVYTLESKDQNNNMVLNMEKTYSSLYIFMTRSNDADPDQTADQILQRLHKYCSIKMIKSKHDIASVKMVPNMNLFLYLNHKRVFWQTVKTKNKYRPKYWALNIFTLALRHILRFLGFHSQHKTHHRLWHLWF